MREARLEIVLEPPSGLIPILRDLPNPLSWRTDGARAPAELNRGAVFLESDDGAPRTRLAGDAQCVDGTLVLEGVGATPRNLPSRILDRVLGQENYHAVEVQLFFMNVRENAASRLAAFLSASEDRPR